MKWKYLIYSGFVSFILVFCSCNCGDSAEGDNGEDYETVRVNNGFAVKDKNGNFTIKRCDKNFADCNKDADDGCETNISTDRNNCGRCENVCQVKENVSNAGCENSVCVIDYCIGGYTDLDKKYENGCEYKCLKSGESEIPYNMQDDDCDGFVDNVCNLQVDSRTYNIASDMGGRLSGLFSVSNSLYIAVAFVESLVGQGSILKLAVIDNGGRSIFSTDIRQIASDCGFGAVAMKLLDGGIEVFWTENCSGASKILFNRISYNGVTMGEPLEVYRGLNPVTNLIFIKYESGTYISFETSENGIKSVFLSEIDTLNYEMISKRVVSTKDLDSFGHNIVIENDKVYVSYCEMKGGGIEVVIMENELYGNGQHRYPVYKTSRNVLGTAIGYGSGYFMLMWTESETSVGTMFITILDSDMVSLLLKRVDFSYEEFGLPVIIYNGNIFGSAFEGMRNGKGYILFSDIDISGKKISELIISPVSLIEKPYMSFSDNVFYVFYTDISSKMKYFLNMKRVYCSEK